VEIDRDYYRIEGTTDRPELGLRHLQSRYVLTYVACVLISVFVIGLVLSLRGRSLVIDKVKSEQMITARAGAQSVGALADSAGKFVESLSKSVLAKGSDYGTIRILLDAQVEHNPFITSIFIFSPDSKTLVATEKGESMAKTLVGDACYDKAVEGAAYCFTGLYRDSDGRRQAYVFVPVFKETGGVSRVFAGGVNLEDKHFINAVSELNPGKKGFSFLVDNRGRLVYSGDPDKQGAIRDVGSFPVVKAVVGGERGSMVYDYGRARMVASFYPVEPLGWGFVTQRPAGEVDNGTGMFFTLLLLFLLISGAAAAAIAVMQTQSVTRFLFFLGSRMDDVARGHIHQEIVPREAAGFAPLASAFNRMVAALTHTLKENDQTLDEVRETARFNQGILSSIQDLFVVVDPLSRVIMLNEKAESFAPAEQRPCSGKELVALGQALGQERLIDAVRKSIETRQVVSVSNVRFSSQQGSDASIFDFRIYPLISESGGAVFYGREVSEFVNKHEKVRNAERFYREAATYTGDALIVLSADLKVEWLNPMAGAMLNVDDSFLGADWNAVVVSRYRDAFAGAIRMSAEEGAAFPPMEMEIEQNGRRLQVEVAAGVIPLGGAGYKSVLTMRLVDSRRNAERAALIEKPILEKRIKFLATIIETLPDELAVVGESGQVIMVNSAFARRFDEQKEVFIGKKFDILSVNGAPVIDQAQLDRGLVVRREAAMRTLRGKPIHAEVHGAAIRNGDGKNYVFSVREIGSERDANLRESRMLEARTRTRMARLVSERFETILANLSAEVKELGGNIFAPDTRAIWENILKFNKDLAHASNSLMMYSIDNPVQLNMSSIEGLVRETLEILEKKGMIPENVSIDTHLERVCPKINADGDQLKMAIWHLILNAMQAAVRNPEGGEVVVRSFFADIDGLPAVVVEILDNGPDFEPSEATRFFEPFNSAKQGSMGLGLTLARRVVLKHNGKIGIERVKGITRSSFYIPLDLTQAQVGRA